jgi:hypothetical protein
MSRHRSLRKIGCSTVDWVGRQKRSQKRDLKIALEIISQMGGLQLRNKQELDNYCHTRDWLDDSSIPENNSLCEELPLLETVPRKSRQFVFGRMENLQPYYACREKFLTLDSKDWDDNYQINDLFTHCAVNSSGYFPIRFVFDPQGGIRSQNADRGLKAYDKNLLTIPQLLKGSQRIHVLSRETCQITAYFGFFLYRSRRYRNIYFASKFSPGQLEKQLRKHELEHVTIS